MEIKRKMPQTYIIQYVKQMVEKGYSISAVRNYLISQGNQAADVDGAINAYVEEQKLKEQAYVQQLVLYIQRQLNQNYSKDWARSALVQQGINTRFIDEAFDILSRSEKPAALTAISSGKLMIVLGVVVMIALGIVMFKFVLPQRTLLDVTATAVTTEVQVGKELVFSVDLTNLGAGKRYDVTLKYYVIDPRTKAILATQTETFAIETSLSKVRKLLVPSEIENGNYELKVVASYDDKKAESSFIFKVSGQTKIEVPEEKPAEQPEEEVIVTKPAKNGTALPQEIPAEEQFIPKKKGKEVIINVENPIQNALDEAATLAKTNYAAAIDKCNQTEANYRPMCISDVARISNRKELCALIAAPDQRDSCYMNFFMMGDYTVCDLINDQQKKDLCNKVGGK